jgi:hypothetical protein
VETFSSERPNENRPSNFDRVAAVEGEIRELVRRDLSPLRRTPHEASAAAELASDLVLGPMGEPVTENLKALIQRVSCTSMEEIDRVILELQAERDLLRTEGDRVVREISGFASLNHAATTSMKVIADSLVQWRGGSGHDTLQQIR